MREDPCCKLRVCPLHTCRADFLPSSFSDGLPQSLPERHAHLKYIGRVNSNKFCCQCVCVCPLFPPTLPIAYTLCIFNLSPLFWPPTLTAHVVYSIIQHYQCHLTGLWFERTFTRANFPAAVTTPTAHVSRRLHYESSFFAASACVCPLLCRSCMLCPLHTYRVDLNPQVVAMSPFHLVLLAPAGELIAIPETAAVGSLHMEQ